MANPVSLHTPSDSGDKPSEEKPSAEQQKRQKSKKDGNWWKNLLFIDNLYKNEGTCFGWSWYLSNDF